MTEIRCVYLPVPCSTACSGVHPAASCTAQLKTVPLALHMSGVQWYLACKRETEPLHQALIKFPW